VHLADVHGNYRGRYVPCNGAVTQNKAHCAGKVAYTETEGLPVRLLCGEDSALKKLIVEKTGPIEKIKTEDEN